MTTRTRYTQLDDHPWTPRVDQIVGMTKIPLAPLATVYDKLEDRYEIWADTDSNQPEYLGSYPSKSMADEMGQWLAHHAAVCQKAYGTCLGFQKVLEWPGIRHAHYVECDTPDCWHTTYVGTECDHPQCIWTGHAENYPTPPLPMTVVHSERLN